MVNKKYNIFIASKNRSSNENIYNFTIYLHNEILIGSNEIANINITGFSMLNTIYNKNITNNTFIIKITDSGNNLISTELIIIPIGNYSVYTLRDKLNELIEYIDLVITYNIPQNTYTITNNNIGTNRYWIIGNDNTNYLGINNEVEIGNSYITSYLNLSDYEKIIIRTPSLVFENLNQDNIKDNEMTISDILFWVDKQDVEPFGLFSYKNVDAGNSYSYNILNKNISSIQLLLYNEKNEILTEASDYYLELQINVMDRNNDDIKNIAVRTSSIIDDIYFTLLNILFRKNNYLI